MNFDDAILAHANWKRKLKAYVANPDRSLRASDVGADDKCALGQWLKAEGRKFAAMPEYVTLTTEHTRFHKAAAELVRKADSGQRVDSEMELNAKGDFAKTTAKVVSAIVAIKQKA